MRLLTNSEGMSNFSEDNCSPSLEKEICSQDDVSEEIPCHAEQQSTTVDQGETLNPWLVVDIIGSPHLTGLIGALTMELYEEVPDLELSAYSEDDEGAYDLRGLDGNGGLMTTHEPQNPQRWFKMASPVVSSNIAALSAYFSKDRPSRMLGPLDELYPFPRLRQRKRPFQSPRTDHLKLEYSLKMKELECKTKLKTMKSMERSGIVDLVDNMRSIAQRYFELQNYRNSETW
jgi:hypothetical protein